MTDLVLSTISSGYNLSLINTNFSLVSDRINGYTIQKSGGNNVMGQDLDINGFSLLNVKTDFNNNGSMLTVADANSHFYRIGLVPTAVNDADAVSYGQAAQMVAAGTSGIITSNVALYSDLASTAVGKGAALVGYLSGTVKSFLDGLNASVLSFIQAGTGAITRFVQDKLRETISVKDFGAKGDGVTDDAAAIAAFALAIAGKNGFMPAGTYLSTAPIAFPSNCTIYGAGMGVTTILQGPAISTTTSFIQLGLNKCHLRDLTVDGNYTANTTYGASSVTSNPSSSGCTVKNVEFRKWNYIALALYSDEVVDGCRFVGDSTAAITPAQYGVWYDVAGARVTVANSFFDKISTNCILTGGVSTITGNTFSGYGTYTGTQSGGIYSSNSTISYTATGNTFLAAGAGSIGIENNYGNNVISGNFITAQAFQGITIEGPGRVVVTGNTITGCYNGVNVMPNISNFSITGNMLSGNTNAQIQIQNGTSNNFTIVGNTISGTGGILDGSSGTTKNITNNVGYNPIAPGGVSITVGASPFSYTNNLGCPVNVSVFNGAVSQVVVNGFIAGTTTNGLYRLAHGKTIQVVYSALPQMVYSGE